jgi:glycosyltransferase involved in cell wall biosynthesis
VGDGRATVSVRISGLINTWNEAENIRYAVASLLPWCDEVLVVDQMSEDGTAEIARGMGARVIEVEPTGYVEIIRKSSVEMATGDWIMVLDADEIVHPRLGPRLREVAESGDWDVVKIPRRNVILGQWLRHGQWWPNDKRRFFHKDHIDIRVEMHGGFHAAPGAREIILPPDPEVCLWHFSYHSLEDLVWKSNRYTTVQAWQRARPTRSPGPRKWLRVTWRMAWKEFVKGRAWKDGRAGIAVSVIRVFDRFLVQAKEWDELASRGRAEAYQAEKERILGLEHMPELAPIDRQAREMLARAPRAPGETEF